ncbi:FAD-binding oxidoreductase [Clostridium ganghwense]|uniref:D-lactate dehydrogenase (cytochrome) n=1 Tax=Clostridium ganghwense TaxID=312089 RepID=A0ABT4CTZ9_9CLOT|nr:FAD-binding oxidoreductase [Clostridium ganghwense]MCY6371444.1 FAD-binding oxidoreductase [Clostridium ganghwense]
MQNSLIRKIEKEHQDYLRDESRKIGKAESISFPKNEKEVIDILVNLNQIETLITTQGARTGIAASAVPQGGHILNLSRMNKITGLRYDDKTQTFFLKVQPGVLLSEIRKSLKDKEFNTENWTEESISSLELLKKSAPYFFSPDPTESTASIGGMVACNASGACSFKYGPTRNHIEALRIVLVDGDVISLKRGQEKASSEHFSLKTKSKRLIEGNIPRYDMPKVKNASGYYSIENMDLIDLFIGSEGTLGVVTEIELKLLKAPASIYGLTAFFPSEENALKFVQEIRKKSSPAAVEFFNSKALDLLRKEKEINPAFNKLLDLPSHFHTAIYVEYHGDSEDLVNTMVMKAGEIIENCGGDENNTWVATNPHAKEQLHFFRHAVPEAVNLLIDKRRKTNPGVTKLGTDMAVPDSSLEEVMDLYNKSLAQYNLDSVMFGHIGNNHIHVNILPNNMDDYNTGKQLYNNWAEKIVKMGGTVSAEHGIGKLKTALLKKMMSEKGIQEMKSLKKLFDPENRLNSGNLFEE